MPVEKKIPDQYTETLDGGYRLVVRFADDKSVTKQPFFAVDTGPYTPCLSHTHGAIYHSRFFPNMPKPEDREAHLVRAREWAEIALEALSLEED